MLSSLIDELLTKSKAAPNEAARRAYEDAASSLKVDVLRAAVNANFVVLEHWVLSSISTLENSKDRAEELLGRRLRASFDRSFGPQSTSPTDALLQENEALLTKIREVEANAWEGFDQGSPTYPRELDIAMQAWRAASNQRGDAVKKPRQQIEDWINENYGS